MIRDNRIALLHHPVSENAVQIERYDQRSLLADRPAGLTQEITLGVDLVVARHRAVQTQIHAVNRAGGAHRATLPPELSGFFSTCMSWSRRSAARSYCSAAMASESCLRSVTIRC